MGSRNQRAWRDAPSPRVFGRMTEASSGRERLIIYLLGKVGLRAGELVALTGDSLDLGDGGLHVPGTKTRFAHRALPLKRYHPEVWNGLVSYFELEEAMRPGTTSSIRSLVKRVAADAGADGVYPHSLRGRAAYDMARTFHGDAVKLCAWMGWRSLAEADAYVRASGAVFLD